MGALQLFDVRLQNAQLILAFHVFDNEIFLRPVVYCLHHRAMPPGGEKPVVRNLRLFHDSDHCEILLRIQRHDYR